MDAWNGAWGRPSTWGPAWGTVRLTGGYGEIPSWREHVQAMHEKHELEREMLVQKRELKKVTRDIRKAEKKVAAAAQQYRHPEGVLANIERLAARRETLRYQIIDYRAQIDALRIMLENFESDEQDEDDLEVLLLA